MKSHRLSLLLNRRSVDRGEPGSSASGGQHGMLLKWYLMLTEAAHGDMGKCREVAQDSGARRWTTGHSGIAESTCNSTVETRLCSLSLFSNLFIEAIRNM